MSVRAEEEGVCVWVCVGEGVPRDGGTMGLWRMNGGESGEGKVE